MAPEALELEITEALLHETNSAAAALIAPLREMGVGFALDDFGTGYSSLASIKRYPLSTVKIHQSFVADLGTADDAGSVAAAIIAGAHAFGKRVVAEGVETETQARALARLGCDHLQGHFCSLPLRAVAFTRFLGHAAARQRPVLAVAGGGC
jgi:EAL domain-containing protein (putative c-di-GMP-specific phosphodiesterase class I)